MARFVALLMAVSLCFSLLSSGAEAAPHGGCLSFRDMPVCTVAGEAPAQVKLKVGKCFDLYLADGTTPADRTGEALGRPEALVSLSRFAPEVPRRPPRA